MSSLLGHMDNRATPILRPVEYCWTLLGRRRGRVWYARRTHCARGAPANVEFDARAALQREEQHGDVVGFLHTHPDGHPQPSDRDVQTMRAWTSAFGKPLLCVIRSDELIAYRFDRGEADGVRLPLARVSARGALIVVDFVDGV